MSTIKQGAHCCFGHLQRGDLFCATITLYTRTWEGKEDPKPYYFYRIKGDNKAITRDKRTIVQIPPNTLVVQCYVEDTTKQVSTHFVQKNV
jgi:hypothetical protein